MSMDKELIEIERINSIRNLCQELYHLARDNGEITRLYDFEHEVSPEYVGEGEDAGILSVWAQVDYWCDCIMGYSSTIVEGRYKDKTSESMKQTGIKSVVGLRNFNVFYIQHVHDWYHGSESVLYPIIKAWIDRVDYLRLLALNYIEMYVIASQPGTNAGSQST
jgi:hypothetical protein